MNDMEKTPRALRRQSIRYYPDLENALNDLERAARASQRLSVRYDSERPLEPVANDVVALLHPEPTKDPRDPLNWSVWKKNSILAIVMWMYFLFTYITTTTVPSFPEIQRQYGVSYSEVSWTVAMPSLGLCIGPLIWSSLSEIMGRRFVFITGTSMALVATIGTALANSYATYMTARFFQGLGVSPGGTVGMAIICDLFFDHERGQKFGFWILAINSGLMIGPIVGGFVNLVNQFWVDWLTAMLFGLLLLVELAFLPETLYPRKHMLKASCQQSTDEEWDQSSVKRTTGLSFFHCKPIPAIKHPKPWDSIVRFFFTFKYPVVSLLVFVFCFSWYWWVMSIVTLIPAAYPQYKSSIQGLLFLGLLLGSWSAELVCSGRLSDALMRRLAKKNGNKVEPTMRLWLAYPAALMSAVGLVLWGASVEQGWHWVVGQLAFFMFAMGLQTGNTVLSAYIVDCYPLQSMSVITFYSVILDLSAFTNPFFINSWVSVYGYTATFAVQGAIVVCVAIPGVALVHFFGADLLVKSGQPSWVNPEYDDILE